MVDEATIIEVELMAATEAVKVVMCLRTQGRSNLISMVIFLTNGKEGKRKTRGRRILMMKMKMILARCDEGRRVKVGVKKQNIEDNEGQKQDEKETENEVIDAQRLMKWTAQLHILFRTSLSYVVLSGSRSLSDFLDSVSNNHRYAVMVQDLATQWIQSYPCKTKTSQETQKSLQKFLEPTRKPKVIYTDNAIEFGKSCEDLLESFYVNTAQIGN